MLDVRMCLRSSSAFSRTFFLLLLSLLEGKELRPITCAILYFLSSALTTDYISRFDPSGVFSCERFLICSYESKKCGFSDEGLRDLIDSIVSDDEGFV